MKAEFEKKDLEQAVKAASGVTPARTPMEVLKNVMLIVGDDVASLSATDSENQIVSFIRGVKVIQPGSCLIPMARLRDIVSTLGDDPVVISETDRSVRVKSGRAEFKIQTDDPEKFPPVDINFPEEFFSVSGEQLAKQIKRAATCVATANESPAMMGIRFQFSENKLLIAGASTDRLSLGEVAILSRTENAGEKLGKFTVAQTKFCLMIAGAVDGEPVDIAATENTMSFRYGDTIIRSQLLTGKHANYERPLNAPEDFRVSVPTEPFINAVRQAKIMTAEDSVAVQFSFSDDVLRLSGEQSTGTSAIEFPITHKGEFDVWLNPEPMLNALRHLGSKEFELAVSANPVKVYAEGWRYFQAALTEKE